jgi:hypothetical protein
VQAFDIGGFDARGTMTNSFLIAGGNPQGTPNTIGTVRIGEGFTASGIRVGVDDQGMDKSGEANSLRSLTIGSTASNATFIAGSFPSTVSINRERIDPLTDARFEIN